MTCFIYSFYSHLWQFIDVVSVWYLPDCGSCIIFVTSRFQCIHQLLAFIFQAPMNTLQRFFLLL